MSKKLRTSKNGRTVKAEHTYTIKFREFELRELLQILDAINEWRLSAYRDEVDFECVHARVLTAFQERRRRSA